MKDRERIHDTVEMIVQFSEIRGEIRNEDFHTLKATLEALFHHSGLGKLDGSDSGGGKRNIYIYGIVDSDWEAAFQMAFKEITRMNLLDRAVVAKSIAWQKIGNINDVTSVDTIYWPEGCTEDFSVW